MSHCNYDERIYDEYYTEPTYTEFFVKSLITLTAKIAKNFEWRICKKVYQTLQVCNRHIFDIN